jgi:hypothetical protein
MNVRRLGDRDERPTDSNAVAPVRITFMHTDDLVILTSSERVYRNGLAFDLVILSKPPMDLLYDFGFDITQRTKPGSLNLILGVRDLDGERSDRVVFLLSGGGGLYRQDFHFWIPIDEKTTLADLTVSWGARGVHESRSLDDRMIRLAMNNVPSERSQ